MLCGQNTINSDELMVKYKVCCTQLETISEQGLLVNDTRSICFVIKSILARSTLVQFSGVSTEILFNHM